MCSPIALLGRSLSPSSKQAEIELVAFLKTFSIKGKGWWIILYGLPEKFCGQGALLEVCKTGTDRTQAPNF